MDAAMTAPWYQLLDDYEELDAIASAFSNGVTHVAGRCGSSTSVLVGALDRHQQSPRLVVTAHLDQADEMIEELQAQGVSVLRFPALETLPGETSVRSDLLAERLRVVQVISEKHPPLVVAPIAALMQPVPLPAELSGMLRTIRPGDQLDRDGLIAWMDQASWVRAATVERPCEYAVRGDVLDIFPEVGEPVRVDVFGDEVESLHCIDIDTMG
jgi:transcription-repair coupling factor (superfamily II helicase)